MEIYRGKCAAGGIAVGRIHIYRKEKTQIRSAVAVDPEAELSRFRQAKRQAAVQLDKLGEKARQKVGEDGAAVFEVHRMMLEDDTYLDYVESVIRDQAVSAEYAVSLASETFSDIFERMTDDAMRSRAADVRDISERMMTVLRGEEESRVSAENKIILIADDLTPSETIQLDTNRILAFATVRGSVHSHTAILARTMGIPALAGILFSSDRVPAADQDGAAKRKEFLEGQMAILDGSEGILYVDPDEETTEKMHRKQEKEQQKKNPLTALKGKESRTLDGQKIALCANISDTRDLAKVLENDAEGIGLFRSEFLYLERDTWPEEEEHFAAYKAAAEAMTGKRVVIRTLDIGADKQADYIGTKAEANPAMGCRAIRVCLTKPDVFKTQLRALYRAAAYGRIAVLYPMITSLKEIRRIREITDAVRQELRDEGKVFGEPEQGIMIETPAAAAISDLLAKEVDFFSIGTNDLTQYLLAADRQNAAMESFYDTMHPAVFRMIAQTVQNAHREGICCGICGELAGEAELTDLFLAMGVDELSVNPSMILSLRREIRQMDLDERAREELMKKWLACD